MKTTQYWIRCESMYGEWDYLGQDGTTERFKAGTAQWNRTKQFHTFKDAFKYAESHCTPRWRVIEAEHMGPGKTWKETTLAAAT